MRRRTVMLKAAQAVLAATALRPARGLAQPAIGGQASRIVHVPQAGLSNLDAVAIPAVVTRNAAAMIFETLYARDESLAPQPLMVEGDLIEDGGKRWTMKLRDGLVFHDGEKVLARDCVASLRRFFQRDAIGETITERLAALEAPDDRTIVWRFNKPFPHLRSALAKTQPTPLMMPERLAAIDSFKQITEAVGCGPFRFIPGEYVAGSRAVFAKFDKYVPRNEPASFCAGGHHVLVDRVEWTAIGDAATAVNALITGEVDWIDQPLPDLLPMLRANGNIKVDLVDLYGVAGQLRPNHMQGPTANPAIRRAMLAAIDQVEVMTAVTGDQPALFHAPAGYFLNGSPSANEAGMDRVRKRPDTATIKAMLKDAGYNGERIVLLHPTDQIIYDAVCQIVVAALRAVGMNIDDQVMDWGTVVQRRSSMEPLDKGGWSLFPTSGNAQDYRDPLVVGSMRGIGRKTFAGWPTDPKFESLRTAWIDSTDEGERRRLVEQMQLQAFENVPFVPMGQYLTPSAWRTSLNGVLKGLFPVFWDVSKT